MSRLVIFLVLYIGANILGFVIGNYLGATDGGLVKGLPGDLLFGAVFGLTQAVTLAWRLPDRRWRLIPIWTIVTMLGFALGVNLGARLAFRVTSDPGWLGVVFGLIVGASVAGAQWLVLRWVFPDHGATVNRFLPAGILAWVAGESIAFAYEFTPQGVPLVGIAIGLLTGIGLAWLIRDRLRIREGELARS